MYEFCVLFFHNDSVHDYRVFTQIAVPNNRVKYCNQDFLCCRCCCFFTFTLQSKTASDKISAQVYIKCRRLQDFVNRKSIVRFFPSAHQSVLKYLNITNVCFK